MPRPRKERVALALPEESVARADLWEQVARTLRDAILSGHLRAGISLVEADLAHQFEVSRGPIREALRELAREGLVVNLPRRGTVVSTLGFADLQEVYAIREGLEIVAGREAAVRANDTEIASLSQDLRRLEGAWDSGAGYADSLVADLEFHRALVALSGNNRLIAIYEQMLSQTQLLARTAATTNPAIQRAQRRSAHRDLIEALLERDVPRLVGAIEAHYAYAGERLFDGLRPE